MEDVLVTPTPNEARQWLGDPQVREGVQALLKKQ